MQDNDEPTAHELELSDDGDGYNEPLSSDYTCACGETIASWVQIDPQCSGRLDLQEVLHKHALHVQQVYESAEREWGVRLPGGNVLSWGSEDDGESKARRAAAMSVTFPGGAHTLVSRYRGEWTEAD